MENGGKMKAKILTIILSFIFLFTRYSNPLYAVTNEIIEDTQNEEILETSDIPENLIKETVESPPIDTQEEIQENLETEESQIFQAKEAIEPIEYQGTMNLETPLNAQKITRPDINKIILRGWAVSNDSNATVRVLLDGNVINSNLQRCERGDVDILISPSYGGTAMTPKAGFSGEIDISSQSIGTHQLRIEQISRFGAVVTWTESTINIMNQNYQGKMYLENPINVQTFTRPAITKIQLQGWAVSNDSNATIRVLLDGNVVNSNLRRCSRGDVDTLISPSYGGAKVTPKAGFSGEIDISNQSAGVHQLKIEEISRFGAVIDSTEMTLNLANQKYQGKIYLEKPTNAQTFTRPDITKVQLQGWAVSNDSNATIRILLDGNVVNNSLARCERLDVDTLISPTYGGAKVTPKAGFSGEIDISNQSAGVHQLKIEEISRFGAVIDSTEMTLNLANQKYQGKIYLEKPTNAQTFTRPDITKVQLQGWAVSNDSNATIRILLDGNVVNNSLARCERLDVDTLISPTYGGAKATPKAGFSGEIDISNQVAGIHKLKVEEISRFGDVITSQEIAININNQKYQGTMNLENPTNGQAFIKQKVSKINLQGWAVSHDKNASVRVLLDGNVVANHLDRVSRLDVDNLVSSSYGGTVATPRAGFQGTIDISNQPVGSHKIRVEQISRFGDLIGAFEINFPIINQPYQGEMCIDTPTFQQTYQQGENMAIGGWAVANDENARVEIYIDNVWKATADRYYRADIVPYMTKYESKTSLAGFGKMLNTSSISAGTHTLTVYEKSRYGDIIGGVERKFVVQAKVMVNPNPPNNNTSTPTTNPTMPNYQTNGTKGIDVSQFQGAINWKQVASTDVKFAMIRIGYRGYGTGGLAEDTRFKTNFANAVASGMKVGVYFYSAAVNTTEAKKDAEYVVNLLKKYGYQNQVSMPVALDLELVSGVNTRDKNVSKSVRTSIANTFSSTIVSYGYTPMLYACKSFLNDNMNASQISCDVWVAQYNTKCTYQGKYTMWQYSSSGKISGINGNVDCNFCYKNY